MKYTTIDLAKPKMGEVIDVVRCHGCQCFWVLPSKLLGTISIGLHAVKSRSFPPKPSTARIQYQECLACVHLFRARLCPVKESTENTRAVCHELPVQYSIGMQKIHLGTWSWWKLNPLVPRARMRDNVRSTNFTSVREISCSSSTD